MFRLGNIKVEEKECAMHCWGMGDQGAGKSKSLESIVRELITRKYGLVFFDPHSSTVSELLKWLAFWKPKVKVNLLDTSERSHIVGIDPFRVESKDPECLATASKNAANATMKAWGHDPLKTPRLTKWLCRFYYTILEQDLPLSAADIFLRYRHPAREQILQGCSIRQEWDELYGMKPERFAQYLEPVESRLEMFKHPQVRRIFSLKENSLDLKKIWDNGEILLVSMQPSGIIGEEENRLIGCLLINSLVQIALERRDKPRRFFLLIDECYKYLTSFATIMDEARKRNISLFAFHQRLKQLDPDTASALSQAGLKIRFSTEDRQMPNRHFVLTTREGRHEQGVMHNVQDYFVRDEKLAAYKQSLIQAYYTAAQVDAILSNTDYEKELAEEDFLQ